ncbi:MAG: dihydrofolate reductase family protein [Solirubrobacterales bacterium]
MGRLIVSEMATLDGIFDDPTGYEGLEHGGWSLTVDQGEDGRRIKVDEVFDAAALLLGRVTYETQMDLWRRAADDSGLAKKAMSLPRYVVSSTLEQPDDPQTTVLGGDVVEQVSMLKQAVDGPILMIGSSQLLRTVFEARLADEIRLMLYPVVIGEGKPLFPRETTARPVKLAHGGTVGDGVAYFVFEPREPSAGIEMTIGDWSR